MKPIALVIAVLAGGTVALAGQPAPVMVGTEPVAASEFKPWLDDDIAVYSGRYAGDIAGDTSGSLEIELAMSGREYIPDSASGVYREEPAGLKPTLVEFTNARFAGAGEAVVHAGAFQIRFVTLGSEKGVVIGGAFIPRQ